MASQMGFTFLMVFLTKRITLVSKSGLKFK